MSALTLEPVQWLPALFGGALIGAAVALVALTHGRVTGISGMLGGLLPGAGGAQRRWQLPFLLGLVGAPLLWVLLSGPVAMRLDASAGVLLLAGLLVGYGTRLGNGCTSGHGVCGTARLSRRSLAATGLFMGAGMAVVALARHGFGA